MKIADLKIGTRLGAGFALLLLFMTVLTVVGILLLRDFQSSTDLMLNDAIAKERLVNEWLADTELNGARTRALLGEGDPAARSSIEEQMKVTSKRISEINGELDRVVASASGKQLYAATSEKRAQYTRARAAAVASGAATGPQVEAMTAALGAYLDSIRAIVEHQQAKSRSDGADILAKGAAGQKVLGALWLVSVALAVAWTVAVTRSIVKPLGQAVEVAQAVAEGKLDAAEHSYAGDETGQLLAALNRMQRDLYRIVSGVRDGSAAIASASDEIAQGNEDLSARTEQQAGSIEETASSMEELTSTVKQNAENARQANQLVEAASRVAVEGGEVVTQVVSTMESINASARKITDIISVIDGIAFQTNILALNAAVEAARAGEQGRGFAVVATEVRNLAHRSASAAKEIKALIETSVHEVDTGTVLVGKAGKTMEDIVASVSRVTSIMREMSNASMEQESGIEQINEAIGQMDTVTQQNAALVEEAAAASAAMRQQAQDLERAVSVFQLAQHRGAHAAEPAARVAPRPAPALRAPRPAARPVLATANGTEWETF
jgi:methyl-accepting chemotaxis protein